MRPQGLFGAVVVCTAAVVLSGCEANPLKVFIARATDLGGVVYVDGASGSDTNDGTATSPLATIQAGIELGSWYLEQELATDVEVRVAEATYEVPNAEDEPIELAEGVSLLGGYAAGFAERDPNRHTTTMLDTRTSGDDVAAVVGGSGITSRTVVDGFTIVGGVASPSGIARAIFLEYASPTISNCTVDAGLGNGAIDLYRESDALIEGTDIVGSNGGAWKFALVASYDSVVTVRDCTIHGGSGGECTAVLFSDARGHIADTAVYGGDADATAWGIRLKNGARVTVNGCTVDGGTSTSDTVTGIEVDEGSVGTIEDCDVFAENPGRTAQGIFVQRDARARINATSVVCGDADRTIAVNVNGAEWANVDRCLLDGGTATTESVAVQGRDTSIAVTNSLISGGTSAGGCEAVVFDTATAQLSNNTICAGSGTSYAFGVSIVNSTPEISNNIIFTAGAPNQKAIHEHDTGAHVRRLLNNLFYLYDAAMYAYHDWDDPGGPGAGAIGVDDLETVLLPKPEVLEVSGNIEDDGTLLVFENESGFDSLVTTLFDNDWRLAASTDADVYEGGTVVVTDTSADFSGVERTDPWSIGAFEYDGP